MPRLNHQNPSSPARDAAMPRNTHREALLWRTHGWAGAGTGQKERGPRGLAPLREFRPDPEVPVVTLTRACALSKQALPWPFCLLRARRHARVFIPLKSHQNNR